MAIKDPYLRFSRVFFSVWFIGVLAICLFVYAIDPYVHYRNSRIFKPIFKSDLEATDDIQRFIYPGLIEHYNYDSILVGSSTAANFISSHLNRILSMSFLKLSMIGESASEMRLILDAALKTGRVKNVVISLDLFTFASKEGPEPSYLWNERKFEDYKYLLSERTLVAAIKTLNANYLHFKLGGEPPNLDLDHAYFYNNRVPPSSAWVLNAFHEKIEEQFFTSRNFGLDGMTTKFDETILSELKAYPSVHFFVFFPPSPILKWVEYSNHHVLDNCLAFKKHVLEQTDAMKNVHLYDFQIADNVGDNLKNFVDLVHYSPALNDFVIHSISEDKFLLTNANFAAHENHFREQVTMASRKYIQ